MWYAITAERSKCMGRKKKFSISSEQVLEELAAIGFARATDYQIGRAHV